MSRSQKNKKRNNSYRPNIWGAIRDVIVTAMAKGQLIPLLILICLPLAFYRMSSSDIKEVFLQFFGILTVNRALGWVLLLICIFAWFWNAKVQRRNHTREVQRISKEKTKLQETLQQKRLPSSNN